MRLVNAGIKKRSIFVDCRDSCMAAEPVALCLLVFLAETIGR